MSSRIALAFAGEAPLAHVDEFGYLHFADAWRLEWWISGDDQWHVPAASASVRQRAVAHTPVIETAMRVPGGDVVWRVGAAASAQGGAIVAELENSAAIPVAIGIALIAPNEDALTRPSVHFTAPARGVASELGVELLVHPVTHGTTWRCSVGETPPSELPPIDAIVRGWQALARQGAQIDFGDETLNDALLAARTSLLLHAGDTDRSVGADVASALTLLGHEDEAGSLRLRSRLKPRRRGLPLVGELTAELRTDTTALLADPRVAARAVAALRARLVDDSARRSLDVFPSATDSWRGRSVDVTNLPTRWGPVSFALRWHGDNPALLWEAPRKVTLRASALAADWTSKAQTGEELLA